MPQRPLPSFVTLWKRHKQRYLDVFSVALRKLSEKDLLCGDEDTISELLFLILNRVCFSKHDVQTPFWEAPIPPKSEDELKGGKSRKRPDFTCKCLNPWAKSPEEHEVCLHVECKRLGNPTSKSWNLNENYVINGIKRFDCKTHEYGKRAPSGMMIGYIISMPLAEIEREVNGYQKKHIPGCPNITFSFDGKRLFQTNQHIRRCHVEPAQFELIHLWVDFRKACHATGVEKI